MNDTTLLPRLTSSQARQIDAACDRFEAEWRGGRRPQIETYLDAIDEAHQSALFQQLLLLDWDYRRNAGEEPSTVEYRDRFPEHQTIVDEVGRQAGHHQVGDRSSGNSFSDRYDLLAEIGHGGIGVVYRGRDRALGRELAVKVLREMHRDKADFRRRLGEEARVGSQLQHPGIVPVYDFGCIGDDRPYFTMKIVDGRTLAEMLLERQDPSEKLSQFISIVEHVCQAMAYAHSRGVIHRDLKPANIMVGAFGEVQVVDWGFAKRLRGSFDGFRDDAQFECQSQDAALSSAGQMMGTPAYIPPEQALGQVALLDARTDVFALGAILCEILTGQPPYVGGTAEANFRLAAAGDLESARERLNSCAADPALRDLTLRCLAPERQERPADAGVLARELSSFLAHMQERLRQAEVERAAAEARAAEAAAKTKAERRALRLALALTAAVMIGGGVAVWQMVVANRARQQAEVAEQHAKAAKLEAEVRERETKAVLDFVQKRILVSARPAGKSGGLGIDTTVRQALTAALPYVDQSFADQPLIEARVRTHIGLTFLQLSEPKIAEGQLSRARDIYTDWRGGDHPDTLRSMNNLASSYAALNRHAEALSLQEKAVAGFKTALGRTHPDTLGSMNNLAVSYYRARRVEDALKVFTEIVALQRESLGADHADTLTAMSNLAATRKALGESEEAFNLEEQVLDLRIAKLGRGHPDTLMSLNNIATSYSGLGRHADAVRIGEEVLRLRMELLGRDHAQTIHSMTNLAVGYSTLGRHADALRLRQDALELLKAKREADDPDVLETTWGIADNLFNLNRGAEAIPLIDDCVRRAAGKDVDAQMIPQLVEVRLRHFESLKDANGCRQSAELWESLNRADSRSLYQAARFRAVTASVERTTPEAADAEAVRAVEWLTKAVAAGYKDAGQLKTDKDFESIRGRQDFQNILRRMEVTLPP
jgi:tetratricopeptide (TPR) repeat protein/tRNA A-37 threonylcarbamoyl transferase component Bud32